MTKKLNPGTIAKLLTQSAEQLDAPTLSALAKARQQALKRQTVRVPVLSLSTGHWTHNLIPHSAPQWLIGGLLAIILLAVGGYWQHAREEKIHELDVAILTSDLPIEVFIH